MQLAVEAKASDGVPFDVVETGGGFSGPSLYCYRPRTAEFITEHSIGVAQLPTYAAALAALRTADGIDRYLRFRAINPGGTDSRLLAQLALNTVLATVFAESAEFEFQEERFDREYAELERTLYDGRALATVLAPVHGLEIESSEVTLGDGLSLARGDVACEIPPGAEWSAAGERPPELFAVLAVDLRGERADAEGEARLRFRRLLSALRLYESGRFGIGPIGFARSDDGPWRPFPVGSEVPTAEPVLLESKQEEEFRGFLNLVASRAPRGGEIIWALRRFELGCERIVPFEALSDYLLALRALLEPEGSESGHLAPRLTAICALASERERVVDRVENAIAIERSAICGMQLPDGRAELLIDELANYLRALLRDAICGHLDSDVCQVADELLNQDAVVA